MRTDNGKVNWVYIAQFLRHGEEFIRNLSELEKLLNVSSITE